MGRQEVGYARKFLSSHEGQFVVFQPILRRVRFQGVEVEGIWEEVVDEGTEGKPTGPGLCEVDHVDVGVGASPALAPDEDGLHLRAQRLLPSDPQLDGKPGVCAYTSTFGIPAQRGLRQGDQIIMYSRVQPRSGVLHLLNQPGHVLEEDVVQLLLLHVLQLERRSVLGPSHDAVVEAEGDKGVSRPTTGKGGWRGYKRRC